MSSPSSPSLAPLLVYPPPVWDPTQVLHFLESHLPLIKSRTLNAFHHELTYGTATTAASYLPQLVAESAIDYRLERLLLEMLRRVVPLERS